MMVGTTLIQVQRWAATVSQNVEALKRCGMTRLPPCTSGAVAVTICALM